MEAHAFGLRSPTMAKVSARRRYREYLSRFSQPKVRQEMAWACGSASRSSKSTEAPSGFVRAHASRREQRFPWSWQSVPLTQFQCDCDVLWTTSAQGVQAPAHTVPPSGNFIVSNDDTPL